MAYRTIRYGTRPGQAWASHGGELTRWVSYTFNTLLAAEHALGDGPGHIEQWVQGPGWVVRDDESEVPHA